MIKNVATVRKIVLKASRDARRRMRGSLQPAFAGPVKWPVECTVGPGLEGAIACESSVGYVNGSQGALLYRGYDIFDLCTDSTYEEVAYLLLHGRLPTRKQLSDYKAKLAVHRHIPETLRLLMSFPVEEMNAMAALRLGTNLLRQKFTQLDLEISKRDIKEAISTDEDSIAMETMPFGEKRAVYEFEMGRKHSRTSREYENAVKDAANLESCSHVLAAVGTLAAAIARLRRGLLPIEPDPELGHAANYLYMLTGRRPTAVEERIMDICMILHADHGMNASTFAAIVVASTLSDVYASVGAGIAALNGPLHGGANELVVKTLEEIGSPENVKKWYAKARSRKQKIMGFGHRVYKTYDPRALVLGPLARSLADGSSKSAQLLLTAIALEDEVVKSLGASKGIYPNVDFFSGLVYAALDVPMELFTPTFAVARVAGWTARVLEYLRNNRLFRPRAIYTGALNSRYVPLSKR